MKDQPEKFDLASHRIAEDKVEEILRLYPEVRTEGGKIDFDKLRLALGEKVDAGKERYGMNWPGKADCFKTIQAPSMGTLLPCPEESINFDTTGNLIIEGDNLEVLKLLQKSYLGKVAMIYIDPPYNTGNDFIYPDNYTESLQTYLEYTGQVDSQGKKFGTNTEADGRFHSKWLNMMYPRLYLARNLLSDDGVIFISIDDREVENLSRVCNEIFGEECFVGLITVLCNPKGRSQDKYFATNHEFILAYSKNILPKGSFSIDKEEDQIESEYPEEDDGGKFRLLELRNTHREFGRNNRKNLYFPIYVETNTGAVSIENTGDLFQVLPNWDDGYEGCWTWDKKKVAKDLDFLTASMVKGQWKIYRKSYASGSDKMLKTIFSDKDFYTERGQKFFNQLFNTKEKIFQSPKSPLLIKSLIKTCLSDNAIILDFFAGSGTTAHAALKINKEDNGNCKYVLIQLPEPTGRKDYKTISDICKERVRRVINKIKEEEDGNLELDNKRQQSLGFRVFKLAESNFKPWGVQAVKDEKTLEKQLEMHVDHILEDRTADDILYELLLKSGYTLTTPVDRITLADKTVYSVDGGALIICLDKKLTAELVHGMADRKPERIICLDDGFSGNDQLKTNAVQIFKTRGIVFKTV